MIAYRWSEEEMITFLRDGSQDKVEVRIGECVGIWKPGGCQWGPRCRYLHPEGRETSMQSKTKDCVFWMEGACKFSPEFCQGLHDAAKFKTRQPKQVKQDFVQALVKDAVSQALTGGAGQAQQGGQPWAGQGASTFQGAGQGGNIFQQAGQGGGVFPQAGQQQQQNLPMQMAPVQ